MTITVQRPPIADTPYTISKVFINDVAFSYCLEDKDRNIYNMNSLEEILKVKVKHETAIPYGTYQVVMSFSDRFQKYLPELLNVPGFSGIRIHSGNTEVDSSGCLLLGQLTGNPADHKVVNSRTTMTAFIKLISSVLKKEKIFIEILPAAAYA